MKHKLFKEFCKHLCAYFFIIFVPVLVLNIAFQQYFLLLYETEIIEQESSTLDRLQVYLDGKFSFIHKAANSLAMNHYLSNSYMASNPSFFYDILSELNSMKSLDSDIVNIYYYNAQASPSTLFSCQGTYNTSTYSRLNPVFFSGYLNTVDRITSITSPTFLPENETIMISHRPAIEYVIPIQNQPAYFIFNINRSLFTEALGKTYQVGYMPYTNIYSDGRLLYSDLDGYISKDAIQFTVSHQQVETQRIGRYRISQITSSVTDLVYMSIIDETLLLRRLHSLYAKFLILNAIVLLSGFVIIYLMSQKYYKPIKHLMKCMDGIGLNLSSGLRSLDQVAEGLNLLNTHNHLLQYERCILKLLSGAFKDLDDFQAKTFCKDIALNYSTYKIMTLSYDGSRPLLGERQEISAEEIQIYSLDYENRNLRVMLVFYPPYMESILMEQLIAYQEWMDGHLPFSYKLCVSRTYEHLSAMPHALLECQELSQDETPVSSLSIYPDHGDLPNETDHYPEAELSGLWDALFHKDSENIQTYVQALIHYLEHLEDKHLLFLPLSYSISHTFQKASGIYGIPSPVMQLSSASRDQLIEEMTVFTQEIIGMIRLQQQEADAYSMPFIIDYIQEHYREKDFCVSSLADHFNLTVSNLSHQFKTSTAVTPSAYIDSLRHEYALVLLKTTSMTIREISETAGYAQPSSFIRRFKQFTDVTPGEWRSQHTK